MAHLVLGLLAGCLVCLLSFLIGAFFGARLERPSTPSIFFKGDNGEANRTEIQRLLASWFDLRVRLAEHAARVRSQQIPLEIVAEWRSDFSRLSAELHEALDQKLSSRSGTMEQRPSGISQTSLDAPSDNEGALSNGQILKLLDEIGADNRDDAQPAVRYPFSVKQPLAPAVGNHSLEAELFFNVQCHDISVRDIRYFVDEMPKEGRVVIGLGVPTPIKWVAGEIESYRNAFKYGRVGYLITARLLGCIDKRDDVRCLLVSAG